MHGGTLKQLIAIFEVQGYAMLIFLPQFRNNVSLFESVICLLPAKLWNSLEARMLYDKCIEN